MTTDRQGWFCHESCRPSHCNISGFWLWPSSLQNMPSETLCQSPEPLMSWKNKGTHSLVYKCHSCWLFCISWSMCVHMFVFLTAKRSRSLSTKSASLLRSWPRSEASIDRHGDPIWKAALAHFTALSTSSYRKLKWKTCSQKVSFICTDKYHKSALMGFFLFCVAYVWSLEPAVGAGNTLQEVSLMGEHNHEVEYSQSITRHSDLNQPLLFVNSCLYRGWCI